MQMILAAVAIINARDDENFKSLDYALIHRRWSTANILHLREAKYSNNERVHRVIGELQEALSRRDKDFRFDFRTSVCCPWPPGLFNKGNRVGYPLKIIICICISHSKQPRSSHWWDVVTLM